MARVHRGAINSLTPLLLAVLVLVVLLPRRGVAALHHHALSEQLAPPHTEVSGVGGVPIQLAQAGTERVLRGEYPDLLAPLSVPLPTASCDATAAPCAARGDGSTDDTAALQHCISKCPRGADGRFAIILKEGHKFLTGSLNLTSGLTLVVDGTVRYRRLSYPTLTALIS